MLKLIRKLWDKETAALQHRGRVTVPAERVPNIFAIGDIHGRLDLLLDAERRIVRHMAGVDQPALVVCLGDFIDRGAESRAVLDHLMSEMPAPFYRICVCGNHDDAFLNFMIEDGFDPAWLSLGGDRTLLSYGVDAMQLLTLDPRGLNLKQVARERVPIEHIEFLQSLPVAVSVGRYLFVHAGVVPGVPVSEQSDVDLMWIREPFLSEGPRLDLTVVHGHTPTKQVQFGPNRIGIDTGAYATGKLSVVHIGAHGVSEI